MNWLAITVSLGAGYVTHKVLDYFQNKDIKILKDTWDNALKCSKISGIKNTKDETFKIFNIERIENGYRCKSCVPVGLKVSTLEDAKEVLESNLNAKISIQKSWDCKYINIEIINHKPTYEFKPFKCDINKLFLGYKLNGKPFLLDLDENPHVGFTGKSGTGKTVNKAMAVTNLLYNYKNNFDMYICQTVNVEDLIFANCKPVKLVATTFDEAKIMVDKLIKIAERRKDKFSKENFTSFKEYNKAHPNQQMKRIFVLLDEFSFFTIEDADSEEIKKLKQECNKEFKRLCKAGRAMGIHIIAVVQKLSSSNIDTTIRSQLSILSLAQFNSTDSNMAVGTSEAKFLAEREAIVNGFGVYEHLFVPTIAGLKKDETTLQGFLHQFIPEIRIPNKISSNNSTKKSRSDELIELTNKLRCTENRKDSNNIIQLEKAREINKEVASGSITSINCEGKYDKQILIHIEKYGCITANQCSKLFYNNTSNARRRLNELTEKGILKVYNHDRVKNEKVYGIKGQYKSHEILIRDFYAQLISEGAKVEKFQIGCSYLNDMIRPDAFIKCKLKNNKEKVLLLEVDYTHYTDKNKIKLYEKMLREKTLGQNFELVIMSNKVIREFEVDKLKIHYLQFKLDNLLHVLNDEKL